MIFFHIYTVVNVLAFVMILWTSFAYRDTEDEFFLIYPQLLDILDGYEVNLAGKVSAVTIISLAFAPAIITWFVLVGVLCGAIMLGAWAFDLFCKIFKKRYK